MIPARPYNPGGVSLETGKRLGPYEILSTIGAGGMGEVYRARDSKLNRDVALKLLPSAFSGDPERMARFEREAQLLASLNHPNIAAIYGLEESVGQRAIVMELVDGREVAGPLPVAEALRIARQIAEAIEFAHDKGVVHRDLKPANIRLTLDGAVKVLDFGLAKALEIADESSWETRIANSPTLSLAATHVGVVLGTAAYMSPEQAKGRHVDRRADVWAFGVVLYELLTGKRLFGGETVSETLASVMKEPFSLDALPTDTPRRIRTLLARCLDRDLRRRLQSIGEARIVIEDVIAGIGQDDSAVTPEPRPRASWTTWLAWAVPVLAMIAAAFWVGARWYESARAVPPVMRFTVLPPEGTTLNTNNASGPHQAISPDGRYIAFVTIPIGSGIGGRGTLWVRALDSFVAQRLDRTEGATYPFWSPDSQQLAFFADGQLKRIPVAGGAPLVVCAAESAEGGTWFQADGEEGVIVFSGGVAGPLHRVPARGGISTAVTKLATGETAHVFPQFLPDGRVVYSSRGDKPAVWVQKLGSDERTRVMEAATRAVYSHPGLLLYVRDDVLLANRFSLDTLALDGDPVAVAQNVRNAAAASRSAFSVSSTGVLVYRGGTSADSVRIRWYERGGQRGDLAHADAGEFNNLELSPDGKYLAVVVGSGESDLWIKDLSSGAFQRVTSLPGAESQEVWSPDSRRLAFATAKGLSYTVVGSGAVAPVPGGEGPYLLEQWTPDGKYLLMRRQGKGPLGLLPAPSSDVTTAADGSSASPQPQPIFTAAYDVDHFRVSPNGKWVSYTSIESGRPEVMVASFPSFTNRKQISIERAAQAQWRADGKELFFHGDLWMMAVDVDPETLKTGRPRELFRTNPAVMSLLVYQYAATPDGQRFVLREPAEGVSTSAEPLYVISNWRKLVEN
jgi:serine/threonine protein kinase